MRREAVCVHDEAAIASALDVMAKDITQTLEAAAPLFLCVVIGGIIPTGLLLPRLDFPLELDYIHATRYRGELEGQSVEWKQKPSIDLQGRTVVLVDDVLDGGLTLSALITFCQEHNADKVYTAVLVDKKRTRETGGLEKADFTGLEADNRYLFGYGMDYKKTLRNAPGIFAIA